MCGLGPCGCGFESYLTDQNFAGLAQLVEHPPCKREVVCSRRTTGTRLQNSVNPKYWKTEFRMIKTCPRHGDTEFSGEARLRCKKCNVETVVRRRKKMKVMALEYKGGSCEKCGYNSCSSALEFHHEDPEFKEFGICESGNTRSWEKLKNELDKCVLLCANCHREAHYLINENKRV